MTRRRRAVGTGGAPLLLAGYAVLLGAWVVTNPPGMSVDEPAHYRRAVSLAHGDVFGVPNGYSRLPAVSDSERAWLNRTTRSLTVPVALHGCDAFRLPVYGRCPPDPTSRLDRLSAPGRELSYVATYPPTGYWAPAAGTRVAEELGGDTSAALRAGRAMAAALCLALVAAAAVLMLSGAWVPGALIGLALALPPMALFLMGQLSTSGAEVASALCTTAAALRLTSPRQGDDPSPSGLAWAALVAGGWTLATSRSLGPVWLVAIGSLVWILRGRARIIAPLRARRMAVVAGGVLAAGTIFTLTWTFLVEPRPPASVWSVLAGIRPALGQLSEVGAQAVGIFGWADVILPRYLSDTWICLVVAVFAGAFLVGTLRERIALVAAAGAALGATIVVSAAIIRPTSPDFQMQGRYVLPLLVTVPLLAADVLGAHRERIAALLRGGERFLACGVVALALVVQAMSLRMNARAYGVRSTFAAEYLEAWRPPGGWTVWGTLVAAAAVMVLLGCVPLTARGRQSRRHGRTRGNETDGEGERSKPEEAQQRKPGSRSCA